MSNERRVIFAIPVYALSERVLDEKVQKKIADLKKEIPQKDSEIFDRAKEYMTFPYRCWKYNHIVGYIEISAMLNDIWFNIYMPYSKKEKTRYHWDTKKKTNIINVSPDCPHFPIFDDESNEQIVAKIASRLMQIIQDSCIIPSHYYVDMESYRLLSRYLDIKSLLQDGRDPKEKGGKQ